MISKQIEHYYIQGLDGISISSNSPNCFNVWSGGSCVSKTIFDLNEARKAAHSRAVDEINYRIDLHNRKIKILEESKASLKSDFFELAKFRID